MTPDRLLRERSILLLAGPGGVGKTTVSAALALVAALEGRRVLVVTIDPARRLADSLGIGELGSEPTPVPLGGMTGADPTGSLHAMMLDTKSAADSMVSRFAPSPEVRDLVLRNGIYRTLSGSLAGSQEYVALGKLYELVGQPEFDLVVVDTAPTRYALDFLEAPTRLLDLLDPGILGKLLKPARMVQRLGFDALRRSSGAVIETLEKVIGLGVLAEVSAFLVAAEGMLSGLRERAERMHSILKDRSRTALAVVTSADLSAVREAGELAQRIRDLSFPLELMVVNRVHPAFSPGGRREIRLQRFLGDPSARAAVARRVEDAGVEQGGLLVKELLDVLRQARLLAGTDRTRLRQVARRHAGFFPVVPVPFYHQEICDLEGLRLLGRELVQGEPLEEGEEA